MTIAITTKVHDGVVIAADSAATLMSQKSTGEVIVSYVFEHADKVVNLYKGLPIGAVCWGAGAIGPASTTRIFKDFRAKLVEEGKFKLDPDKYTIEDITVKLREYVYEQLYVPTFKDWPDKPAMGILVSGFSKARGLAEGWLIEVESGGTCGPPRCVLSYPDFGIYFNGQGEAISRIVLGFSEILPPVLANRNVSADDIDGIINDLRDYISLYTPGMPIQDAIDLTAWLAHVSIEFSRFSPGPATIGGTIDIATITKHEGFKWIKRKLYYDTKLNP
jgi:hypothetical protein